MDIMSVTGNKIQIDAENSRTFKKDVNETEKDDNKAELRKAAKEMESIFAYQLIKIMRDTTKGMSSETEGLGKDTYMSMFDIEISRLFAEKGLGLQDMIVEQLGRMEKPDSE